MFVQVCNITSSLHSLLVAPPHQIPEVGLASDSLLVPSPTLPSPPLPLHWTLLGMKDAGRMSHEEGFVGDVSLPVV